MYNCEVTPPAQSWQAISAALDKEKHIYLSLKKNNRIFHFSLAAASVTILFFSALIWYDNSDRMDRAIAAQTLNVNNGRNSERSISRSGEDKITVPAGTEGSELLTSGRNEIDEKKRNAGAEHTLKKYITISGPQGQPVKISAKVASLIVYSNDQYPAKTVWSDKVKKWKDIMKAHTLAPTTANFLDIVELTHAVRINNP